MLNRIFTTNGLLLIASSLAVFVSAYLDFISTASLFEGLVRLAVYLMFWGALFCNFEGLQWGISARVLRLLFLMQCVLSSGLILTNVESIEGLLYAVVVAQLPYLFNARISALIIVIMLAVIAFSAERIAGWGEALPWTVAYAGFFIFAISVSHAAWKEMSMRQALADSHRQLNATRALLLQTTRRQERLRIARDLHDVVGHQMTALTLNLELAKHKVNAEAVESINEALLLSRQLLSDVRSIVRAIRDSDTIDLQDALHQLGAHIPGVSFRVITQVNVNSSLLAEQLLFCAQEGITNALKHGHATEIEVLLFVPQPNWVCLRIVDNGHGGSPDTLREGSGLRGMRERLAPFAGELVLESNQPQGFIVSIHVPEVNRDPHSPC